MHETVKVIGAGLAGSEAAWQLARRGITVELFEMRPLQMTAAHKTGQCGELVCSNSLGGTDLSHASGLLKAELRSLGSLLMEAAETAKVPAGTALAVDRGSFSAHIEARLESEPNIRRTIAEIGEIPAGPSALTVIASGPLTSPALAQSIQEITGSSQLAFFDAISPIVTLASLDQTRIFRASRYGKGGGDDYFNIPLDRDAYYAFVDAVEKADKTVPHLKQEADLEGTDPELRPFEGCMPIEDIIARGRDSLKFGPLKPKGLTDPATGREPYAVIQLRQDNREGTLWSMVGMQTRMKHGEQLRILRSLPGLKDAEFVRLGSVHRNTFINSPQCLTPALQSRSHPTLFFAGQLIGTEGYVESIGGGLLAGINAARLVQGKELLTLPPTTALGALIAYVTDPARKDFQPMNANFGLLPQYLERRTALKRSSKKDIRRAVAEEALEELRKMLVAAGEG